MIPSSGVPTGRNIGSEAEAIGCETKAVEPSDENLQTRTIDLPDVLIFRSLVKPHR
jgi:hypothetical protein